MDTLSSNNTQANYTHLFKIYNTLATIYHAALSVHHYDKEKITEACREALLKEETIGEESPFYLIKASDGSSVWYPYLSLSKGEAVARVATARRRYPERWYTHTLQPQKSFEIEEVTLRKVIEDVVWLSLLVERMEWLSPVEVSVWSESALEMVWCFEEDYEAHFLLSDGERLFVPQESKLDLASLFVSNHFTVVIDETGRYGVIRDRRERYLDDPDVVWQWKCDSYYIHIDGKLAEVQKQTPPQSDDYRVYLCEIVDLYRNTVVAPRALCGSLEYRGEFLTVEGDGSLRYVRVDNDKRFTSKPYKTIVTRGYEYNAVQDRQTGLWGYTDKEGREIIPTQFDDYAPFNSGYAVVRKEGCDMAIDLQGEVIIPPHYLKIIHDEKEYFFVKDHTGWALFRRGEAKSVFIDIDTTLDETFVRDHLPFWLNEEKEIQHAIKETLAMDETGRATFFLKHLKSDQASALQSHRYTLPLKEYLALFDTIESHKELEEAGLWYHPVKVTKIPERYRDVVVAQEHYMIGWDYPATASMFDMSVELPVIFTKKDGSSLTIGIGVEDLVLVRVV